MEKKVQLNYKWVLSILSLGFSSLITQNILLREFLSVFHGNELVIGIILANWMLLTGAGAYAGRYIKETRDKHSWLFISLILIGLFPVITAFLINYLRNSFFLPGVMVGLFQIIYLSFLFLLPFCLITGSFFTLLATTISEYYKTNLIRKVYAFEALGSIIGGLLFNFIFIYLLDTYTSLLILLIINSIIVLITSYFYKPVYIKIIALFLIITGLITIVMFDLNHIAKSYLHKNQELIFTKDTPYGNISITKTAGQYNFYENNQLAFSTNNNKQNEENTHYVMVQHPCPESVLLISGGITGIVNEVAKYDVEQIDYVEMNPWIIKVGEKYTDHLEHRKLHIINKDARLFIKETKKQYDVILVNLADPYTANLNRYYTIEFFRELKNIAAEQGIVMISATGTENYMGEEVKNTLSVIYKTFGEVFTNTLIIPGGQTYMIGSAVDLDINIPSLIDQKNINNDYVNKHYIDINSLKQRNRQIMNNLKKNVPVNNDFYPVAYFMQIKYWMSFFETKSWIILVFLTGLLFFFWFRLTSTGLGMFTAGFTSSSIEIILVMAFQVIYGYVYHIIGLFITVFMAGLAAGALYYHKIIPAINMKVFRRLQYILGTFTIIIPLVLLLLKTIPVNTIIVHIIIFVLMFVAAALTGMIFSLASQLRKKGIAQTSAETYSADLAGSAIGLFLLSVFLIPMLGIINVLFLVGGLNILCGLILQNKN